MKNKKSQLTVFFILGIVILLTLALSLYFFTTSRKVAETQIYEEVSPVQKYVDSCLELVSKKALEQLGLQGGYTTLPNNIDVDKDKYIDMDGKGVLKVPIWGSAISGFHTPSEQEMTTQLMQYVDQNLELCIDNFKPFKDVFIVEERGSPKTKVEIQENDVVFSLNYPLFIHNLALNKNRKVSKFIKIQPVRLRKIIEYANAIIMHENKEKFLEKITLDIMSADPDIPLDGIEIHCGPIKWFKSQIKQRLQEHMREILPELRFYETDFVPFEANPAVYEELKKITMEEYIENNTGVNLTRPSDVYYYNHLLIDIPEITTNDYKRFKILVNYEPQYGMRLQVRPSEGNILSSRQQRGPSKLLSWLCINTYHFTYDIFYPILISIYDQESYNGEGYLFQFAIPVIIDHNEPHKGFIDVSRFESLYYEIDECADKSGPAYIIRATSYELGEISDVDFVYDCIKFQCKLGTSKFEAGHSQLVTQLPQSCVNGFIRATKEGYLEGVKQATSTLIEIPLVELKRVKLVPMIYHYYIGTGGTVIWDSPILLNQNVTISVLMDGIKPQHYAYAAFGIGELNDTTIELTLSDQSYDTTILMQDNERGAILGGWYGTFNYTAREIAGANVLEIPLVGPRYYPLTEDERNQVIMFIFNQTYYPTIMPRFK